MFSLSSLSVVLTMGSLCVCVCVCVFVCVFVCVCLYVCTPSLLRIIIINAYKVLLLCHLL